ncbi:MAG TPA: hypothetical protein PLM98_03095, partial [Thiolinea sp.]|nr:hypothetical protein [Thiolinea sp.]
MLNSIANDFQHLTIQRDQHVIWIGLAVKGSTLNLFTPELIVELQQAYKMALSLGLRALIIYSARPQVFSAGLDLKLL